MTLTLLHMKMDGFLIMNDILFLFAAMIFVFVCIIAYLLYYTNTLVHRNDIQTQKVFDSVLALLNNRAALTAANMQNIRARTEQTSSNPSLSPSPEEIERIKRRHEVDNFLESLSYKTVLDPEDEQKLAEMERNGHRV